SEEFGIVLSTSEYSSKYAKASSNLKSIGKFAGYFGNVISAHQLVSTISQYDDMDRLIYDLVWDSNLSSNSKEELILRYSYISVYLSNLIESEYLEYSYVKGELQHNLSSDESIALNRRLRDNLKKIINK